MSFPEDLAAARAKEGNTKTVVEIKKMQQTEMQREVTAWIWQMNGNIRTSLGLTQAVAPNTVEIWVEMNSQNNLEEALRGENERQFTQANQSPLMCGILFEDLGTFPDHDITKRIFSGQYDIQPHHKEAIGDVIEYLCNINIDNCPFW